MAIPTPIVLVVEAGRMFRDGHKIGYARRWDEAVAETIAKRERWTKHLKPGGRSHG